MTRPSLSPQPKNAEPNSRPGATLRPCRAKLSPADWTGKYLSKASCRNVLIDLLAGATAPGSFKGERTLAYEISAAAK